MSGRGGRPSLDQVASHCVAFIGRANRILSFRRSLSTRYARLGYTDGDNFDFAPRFADGYIDRLPVLAQELVQLRPSVILAPASGPSDAVRFVRVGADCQARFLLPCREDQRPVSAEADARRARRTTPGTGVQCIGARGKDDASRAALASFAARTCACAAGYCVSFARALAACGDLDPKPIVLDLMQPFAAGGQLVGFACKARRDEPGRQGTR